jgi:hypothetical protein
MPASSLDQLRVLAVQVITRSVSRWFSQTILPSISAMLFGFFELSESARGIAKAMFFEQRGRYTNRSS